MKYQNIKKYRASEDIHNFKAQQLKELEASFAAATKEMQSAQAKMAVETAKEVLPPLLFSHKMS